MINVQPVATEAGGVAADDDDVDDVLFRLQWCENFAGVSLLRHFARLFWNHTCSKGQNPLQQFPRS